MKLVLYSPAIMYDILYIILNFLKIKFNMKSLLNKSILLYAVR